MTDDTTQLLARAAALDATDPLAEFAERFVPASGVVAYLDGNSLGRPLRATSSRIDAFVRGAWGSRLIRSWDEQWMELPLTLGDRVGAIALGAAAGQTVVADSTTVMLFKLISAAVRLRPGRSEILIEGSNFPTDRFVASGIAAAHGLELRVLAGDPLTGVSAEDVAEAVSERTALVVLSHIDYRSGAVADRPAITAAAHAAGALILWDLCHSVGAVPLELDRCGVDFAVGCTYKYLNGGPGSPAFAYVRSDLQGSAEQPIWGWMGAANVFEMREQYEPASGMRRFISGTPPVLGMLPLMDMLDLVEEAGLARIRAKSHSLTALAIEAYDQVLAPLGVTLRTARDPELRGGHVTFGHERFQEITLRLWGDGVLPDYRHPGGIRIGLSPLSTSHAETLRGVLAIRDALV